MTGVAVLSLLISHINLGVSSYSGGDDVFDTVQNYLELPLLSCRLGGRVSPREACLQAARPRGRSRRAEWSTRMNPSIVVTQDRPENALQTAKSVQGGSPAKVRTSPRLPRPGAGVQVQKRPSPYIVKDTHESDASKKTKEVKGHMQWNARSTAAAAASTASALHKLHDSCMLLWLPRTVGA